jgi:hypothetical protein
MEELVGRLVARQRCRWAITLVERWAETSEPTVDARLAEARALLDLRMVDRAWLRVRDLVETAEPSSDALAVAAELFLLRGGPNQAKKLIQRGLERTPGDPVFTALERRAQEPATALEDEPGENAAVGDLVRMAEHYMVRGAFLRARTLLERARRRQPDHERVGDLLWALSGDYSTPEPLHALVQKYAHELGPDEDGDEPEHTENARAEDLRPENEVPFPQLFRTLEKTDPTADTSMPTPLTPLETADFSGVEVTAITALSELGLDATFGDKTDHGEDTQIARVMSKSGPVAIHRGADTVVESGFNLKDFRRDMGMTHAADLEVAGEDEDDNVVIHTRVVDEDTEPGAGDALKSLGSDAGFERLAKSQVRGEGVDESWARAPSSAPTLPPDDDVPLRAPLPSPRTAAPPPRPVLDPSAVLDAWPYWLAAIAALFAMFVRMFAVLSVVAAIGP